jgi:putative aldouronate transport system substrate-binding protein
MKKRFIARAATAAAALIMASGLAACDITKVTEVVKGFGIGTGSTGGTSSSDLGLLDPLDGYTARRPEVITVMADTCMTKENGLEKVCEEFQNRTGIKLSIEKPDHNQYYEKVNLNFAAGTVCDVIEMGGTYYPNYASADALWDMTDAWESSELYKSGKVNEKYVDALKIPGGDGVERLYGFPMAKGNGTVTYVRKDWMDALGIENPTNYDEFISMLRRFKNEIAQHPDYKDDLKGKKVIPLTAAGLINTETPYNIYMPEFYQDANPDFYQNENGEWIDGMLQPEMKDALQRMKDAYDEGLIDIEVVTNKTSTCRDKFYDDRVGCFNYWAGSWNKTLQDNLESGKGDNYKGQVAPLEPIVEATYIERPPTALIINTGYSGDDERRRGIFEYFILYAHDGGEGQLLFTRGVEGIHWRTPETDNEKATGIIDVPEEEKKDKATIVEEQENSAATNAEKGINPEYSRVALPFLETPKKLVEKSYFAPELNIVDGYSEYENMYTNNLISSSLELFENNSTIAKVPKVSSDISEVLPDLALVRREVIAKAVTGKLSIDEAIAEYKESAAKEQATILKALNG